MILRVIVSALMIAFGPMLYAANVTLSWQKPTKDESGNQLKDGFLSAYFIHHYFDGKEDWQEVSADLTSKELEIDGEGEHCFKMRAHGMKDGEVLKSKLSEQVCVNLELKPVPPLPPTNLILSQ